MGHECVGCRGGHAPKRAVAHLQMQGPALKYGCATTAENASEKKGGLQPNTNKNRSKGEVKCKGNRRGWAGEKTG